MDREEERHKLQNTKPLIKWAGGKYRLSEQIIPLIESRVNLRSVDRYVEPFLGGGGMLLSMLNREYGFSEIIASDLNGELINMYVQVRDEPARVAKGLKLLEERFNLLKTATDKKEMYLDLRKNYNEGIRKIDRDVEQAVLLIALNKLCFNGLYRVNLSGFFNVPFGKKNSISLADYDNIFSVSKQIQKVKFVEGGFESSLLYAKEGVFYYFDSPYRPLSKTEAFTNYAKSPFNDDTQRKLASMTEKLQERGAQFAMSNSNPMEAEPPDPFFNNLYNHATIYTVDARRAIGASASSRKTVSEILAVG